MESNVISTKMISITDIPPEDLKKSLFDADDQLSWYVPNADRLDYFIAISSGLIAGMIDALWVKDFSLVEGKEFGKEQTKSFVKKVAKITGCKSDDLDKCIEHLEDNFRLASDGNKNDFGGGTAHHLRDFAHHPTIVGLAFSLLSQFTGLAYGTNTAGQFITVPIKDSPLYPIGKDIPTKILYGTVYWFFI